MSKAVRFVGGLVLTAVGVVTGNVALAASGVSMSLGAITEKKAPVTTGQISRISASIDPQTKRKTPFGSTAFPLDVRYEEWFGTDQERCGWIVAHASCAIQSVDEIWINDELAWTSSAGSIGKYNGYFFVRRIVLEGGPGSIATVSSANKWNANHRLTGCAYSHWEFKVTGNSKKAESPFASGIPTRITVIGKGAKLYDPRRDSTVPGGSGPMRADDQSTWRFIADDGVTIGENLALQILRTKLGWRIQNPSTGTWKLATGMGLPKRRIDLESYISAANICDEAVAKAAGGTEARYQGAAVISEEDDPRSVHDMLCAACCGRITERSGKLGLAIAHNDLAAVVTDEGLNEDDVMGPFTWDPDPSLDATPNIVRGRYTDASSNSLYQLLPYPEVKITSPDGIDRPLTLDLAAVESPSQAQRVAAQTLMRRQYQRSFTAPFDIRAWKYRPHDVLPFTFAPLGFDRKIFRVVDQERGQGGICNMTLRVEDPAIYPAGGADAPAVQSAAPTVYDTRNSPIVLGIAEVGATADAALAQLELLGDDGVLTIDEKIRKLQPLNAQLAQEWALLDAEAAKFTTFPSVVAARSTASSAYSSWTTYRDGLSPAWNNLSIETYVTRATFNGKLNDLRYALTALAEAVRLAAATMAGWMDGPGIYDPFDYATLAELQEAWERSGAVLPTIVSTNDTGGVSIQGGDNAGNDSFNLTSLRTIPYSPEDLHEIAFDIEGLDGGIMYLGVVPIDAAGNILVPSDAGSYCYVAASGHGQAGRKTWRGYFRGTAAVGAGNLVGAYAPDPANPSPLPTGTVKVAAIGLFNYPNTPGRVRVHKMTLRKIVENTVIATGAWSSTRSYYRNEGVTYLGRSFGSKLDGNLNHQPPGTATSDSWWYLIADKGADGAGALTGFLTNESHTLPADAAGAITSYSGAIGAFKVFSGSTDVTSSFTFSIPSGGNPQGLSVTDGSVPFANGGYSVIGGFDAGEANATVTLRATGTGAFAGQSIDKVFSLSKSKAGAGGAAGVSPPLIIVTSTHQTFNYDKVGNPLAQTTTFVANRQNTSSATAWTLRKADGTILIGPTTAATMVAAGGASSAPNNDTLTLSQAQFNSIITGNGTTGLIYEASVLTVTDRISIVKVQDGEDGADGATGAPGVSPILLSLSVVAMDVAADSNNVTKAGALPKGSVVTLKQGTTTLTPSSVTFTYSDGGAGAFAADYGVVANTVRVTTANAPGWVDVNVVYAGITYTQRIAISRSKDPAPPPSQTSDFQPVSGGSSTGATTYDGSGILSPEIVLRANASGQLTASFNAEYFTDTPPSSARTLTMAARGEIAPQSTGVFSAPLAEQAGTQAFWDKTDATSGIVAWGGTFSGLTPFAYYRVRINTRKVSGSNPSAYIQTGEFSVTQ